MLFRCYAKLNLSLEVLGRRADGYHDIASVVHTISLADDLRIEPSDEVLTRVEGLDIVPGENLVTRAARLLAHVTRARAGAQMTLIKRIPAAAGLGGGSSDAAAALVGLNAIWGTRLGYHALGKLALQLGSDVPFFLRGGAALMQGRGEALSGLPPLLGQWLVLVVPTLPVVNKTASLYAALRPGDFSDGERSATLARRFEDRLGLAAGLMVNSFERAARDVFPGLDALWREIEERCARRFFLSGAGPALFALASDRAEARSVAQALHTSDVACHAVRTVKHARASRTIEYA
jgi:4-diphosphocytidyl-2-C-methyl-D-erythritol kinase